MCHLLLLLPLLALAVLWLLPASVAVPIYATAALVSGIVYRHAWKSARMPKLNGAEAMLGARGRVGAMHARYRDRLLVLQAVTQPLMTPCRGQTTDVR